jgi:two-component system response regulator HydG/two-component system response regulator AtoC
LPEHLVESELFGHERGAFTGALSRTNGKLQLADKGTIFFDEIGDMSPPAQAKLLRAIENRTIYRVGGQQAISLNIRIIAATNRDLDALSRTGSFRSDLFYRLNVARIDVPPLRERRADIRTLLSHYVDSFNRGLARNVSGFTEAVLTRLSEYEWPGNVRELRNLVESTFVYSSSRDFSWADVPPHFRNTVLRETPALESERDRILNVLVATDWNRSLAARRLHLSRMTLYRKMNRYSIAKPA